MKCFFHTLFPVIFLASVICISRSEILPQCSNLQPEQMSCVSPSIDMTTQELSGCLENNSAAGHCSALNGVLCEGPRNWTSYFPCRYTNGYQFEVALSLSVFLGYLGIDRFYLGYPTIGLMKLFTFGGFIVGNWVDIILIASQVLKPADGSNFVIGLNGPRLKEIVANNQTYHS